MQFKTSCFKCIDQNSEVIDGECRCKEGFYEMNPSLNEGDCKPYIENCLKSNFSNSQFIFYQCIEGYFLYNGVCDLNCNSMIKMILHQF